MTDGRTSRSHAMTPLSPSSSSPSTPPLPCSVLFTSVLAPKGEREGEQGCSFPPLLLTECVARAPPVRRPVETAAVAMR